MNSLSTSTSTSPSTERGSISLMTAVAIVPLFIMCAVVADTARVWAHRTTLQNGVEAAAVAVAKKWTSGQSQCQQTDLSLVSRNGAAPARVTCTVTGSSTQGVVHVSALEDVNLMFASLLGRDNADINASTGVRVGPTSSAFALRPFALCEKNSAVRAWINSNFTLTTSATITFASSGTDCGGAVPGNWGVLDFNGGSNSTSETESWIAGGYAPEIKVGDVIAGNPGAPSSSLKTTGMVGQHVVVPLFSTVTLQGNHAVYTISGFAQVYVQGIVLTGTSSKRAITIRFERGTTRGTAGSAFSQNFGLTTWTICSYDSHGKCS